MSTPKGWPTQEKDQRLIPQFATVEPVHTLQHGLSVLAHQYVAEVGTDAAEAGSSAIAIVATAHAAQAGDVIRLTSGALSSREIKVYETAVNLITLAEELPSAVATGVTFQILRHKYPLVEPTGEVKISGSFTATEEAVAADGGALPAKVKVAGGYDGTNVQVLSTDSSGHLQVDVLTMPSVSGGATAAAQTDGSQKTQIVDGSGNVIGSTSNALDVNIKSGVSIDVTLSNASDDVLVYGFDGAANRKIKTDASGELQVDVLSCVLPTNAATSTIQTDGSQKTRITSGGNDATVEALGNVLNNVSSQALVVKGTVFGVPAAGGNPVVLRTTDTFGRLSVDVNTMPAISIPAGASTYAAQTDGSQKTQIVDSTGEIVEVKALNVALAATDKGLITHSVIQGQTSGGVYVDVKATASGALNTESTLAGLDASILGQDTMANSLPVVISSDQTAIPVTGSFTAGKLSVVDLLDANILDTSSTNIPGSASSPVQVIASTAAEIKAIQLLDTTGAFVGVYVGGIGSEVLKFVMGPGSDQTIEHNIPAASRVSLKRLDSTAAVSSGIVAMNCMG